VPKVQNDDLVPMTVDLLNPKSISIDSVENYCAKFQVIHSKQGFSFYHANIVHTHTHPDTHPHTHMHTHINTHPHKLSIMTN